MHRPIAGTLPLTPKRPERRETWTGRRVVEWTDHSTASVSSPLRKCQARQQGEPSGGFQLYLDTDKVTGCGMSHTRTVSKQEEKREGNPERTPGGDGGWGV